MKIFGALLPLALCVSAPALAQTPSPAITDPAPDTAFPAGNDAFVIPVKGGAMNALIYTASGGQPHPTLILFHGFPGNEQNLDLAQAARRAGWNVLTMHYHGSWGSPGNFSFGGSADDAHAAIAFVRDPAIAAKYHIDPKRIALAGHSMGGFMASDAAADDKDVIGLFIIDAWNIAGTGRALATETGQKAWHEMVVADLPPLAGTNEEALTAEIVKGGDRFDIERRLAAYGKRPLAIYGAARARGVDVPGYVKAARDAGNTQVTTAVWQTDHPFSDKRIALSEALVAWLGTLPGKVQ
ncbi:MAG: alpha/beta fold hydrolase [Sphingomonas sp.]|uniref:alpha/beta hydrolase family protein n=1 Tax=Sphingomonas sp. TaxID=28214 RepID=UPI0035A92F36|nr:alpha/beta fold hydrolase [Sphingomonas sp.]